MPADLSDSLASAELMGQLMRRGDYNEWIEEWLG
jgi:hypothetical protein